jgi:RNA polymerase sigma-70 factor (ECF subfamily)
LPCELELRALVAALVRDRQAREDIFQDIALTLWKEFARYDRSRPFAAWARGVAANRVLQHWKRTGRAAVPFSPEAIAAMMDAQTRPDVSPGVQLDALEHCLRRLPARWRRLLHWRYGESLKVCDIAARTGRTAAAVSQVLWRVRQRLQECMERWLTAEASNAEASHG